MTPGTRWTWGVIIQRALNGEIGVGSWTGVPNSLDFSQREPGDIVIGGNPGASWGHYTHATLYLGDGQVAETLLREGVNTGPVSRYHDYTWAGALQVKAPPEAWAKPPACGGFPLCWIYWARSIRSRVAAEVPRPIRTRCHLNGS